MSLGQGYIYDVFDNSPLTLNDMERYGVDMAVLLPSWPGTTSEMQLELVNNNPGKFVAMCSDQKLRIAVCKGEVEWTLQAAVDEVEALLKTGNYVGIGEFTPRNFHPKKIYEFKERLDEYRTFAELARKYDVVLSYHDWAGFPYDEHLLLQKLAGEYPDVNIVMNHGGGHEVESVKKAVDVISWVAMGGAFNVFLETGSWTAELYLIALKHPNCGATQLIWGHDYGNVPQYMVPFPPKESGAAMPPYFMGKWTRVPTYQTDFWGWALHEIHRLRDMNVGQDEINLILGGNAARIFKLPVPYERMFPEGRVDLWGVNWEKSVPFIPLDQIQYPDKKL